MTPSISNEVFSATLATAGMLSAPFHSEAYKATQRDMKISFLRFNCLSFYVPSRTDYQKKPSNLLLNPFLQLPMFCYLPAFTSDSLIHLLFAV